MKKIITLITTACLFALSLFSVVGTAQTYPSPTFQNMTVSGTATIANSALSGGSINGATIGATTPSTGVFTTLSSTSLASFSSLSATTANPTLYYNQGGTGAVNRTFTARMQDSVSVKDLGAACNGSTDDSSVFGSSTSSSLTVPAGSANCIIATNTTATANLTFTGGVITVNSGVTLTINGDVIAPHKVIFQGAGTVVINRGIIDVAWFDGADASTKTAFALRGVQNTGGTGKTLAYYPPQPNDAWATTSLNNEWGYGWKVNAPIDIENTQAYTTFLTYSTFIVTTNSMSSVWQIGAGTSKADGLQFPVPLRIDGGNGLATWAIQIYGSSHTYFSALYLYAGSGIAFTPNGSKQVSDIYVGYIDTGELYGQAVMMDGSNGTNNTITDIDIGLVNSTGFISGHAADSVVKIGSNTNAVTIRRVSHRAVVGGRVDATNGIVLITNQGGFGTLVSPRYGISIGPVINGSTTQTAQCVVVSDGSGGTAAKMTGITIVAGSENDTGTPPGNAAINLNYTNGAIVQGLPMASAGNNAQKVFVQSASTDTKIYGVNPNQVFDSGTGTLIDGHNYSAITSLTPGASPWTWTNNLNYPVDFWGQASTSLSAASYTRGGNSFSVPVTSNTVIYTVAPGDSITATYTGTLTAKYLPR